jgi:L-threonylcarbamoyladenylate synthase
MPLVSSDILIQKAIVNCVVSFPTDTLPALAVKPQQSEAIFQLKQRSYEKPLILMLGDIEDIWQYVQGTPTEINIWKQIAHQYLPGALTMVLPTSEKIPPTMNPQNPTSIGVRVPNNEEARNILRNTGGLATTSANLSGESALTTMSAIANKFPSVYALDSTYEGNSGVASTVIKWSNHNWEVLRQGQINLS